MDEPRRLIIWSPEAVADLDGIWDYFEHTANYQKNAAPDWSGVFSFLLLS